MGEQSQNGRRLGVADGAAGMVRSGREDKGMNLRGGLVIVALGLCAAGMLAAQGPLPPPPSMQDQQPLPLPLPAQAQPQPQTQPQVQNQPQNQPQDQSPTPSQAQIEARIEAQGKAQAGGEPTLKPNPLELLRSLEPAANAEYELGKGDEITVDFAGRPDLLAKLIVGPDGRITLPLAGDILLNGLTREQAAQAIEKALAPYYSNLVVTVTVTKYTANRVVVLGAVDHPGTITFDGTPTLLEALARGGVQAGPDNRSGGQTPVANEIPERCAIYRGNDQVIWIQLRKLVETGDALANLRLRRDDVIYVPSSSDDFISVLGEVQHPGPVPITYNATLASIVASAGGFTPGAGSKPHVEIVDPATGTTRKLSFAEVLNPGKSSEIQLKPGEIVFVPQSGFYHATYFLERLNPLVTVATIAFYAGAI